MLPEFVNAPGWRFLSCASMSRSLIDLIVLSSFKASLKTAGEITAIRGGFDISFKLPSKKRTVHATADYVSGYSPYKDWTKSEPCSVMIQAKKAFGVCEELPQTLACMVGVQQHKINSGLEAGAVYGADTNGVHWQFLRLNGQTRQMGSIYMSTLPKDKPMIVLFSDVIFKATISASTK
jgi:hypothetical protein